MDQYLRNVATWQARLLSGVVFATAAFAAGVVAALPNPGWVAWAGVLLVLVPAAVAWVIAAISGGNPAYPHDIKLLERIMALLSEEQRDFLRRHDFANNFSLDSLAGVFEISYWEGSASEFLDQTVQPKWRELKSGIAELRDLVAGTTAPQRGNVRTQTVYPHSVDPEEPTPRVLEEISALNHAATRVTQLLDLFEPLARRRLVA